MSNAIICHGVKFKEEFDKNLQEFLNPDSDKPIILEVFTKKEDDARLQHEFFSEAA